MNKKNSMSRAVFSVGLTWFDIYNIYYAAPVHVFSYSADRWSRDAKMALPHGKVSANQFAFCDCQIFFSKFSDRFSHVVVWICLITVACTNHFNLKSLFHL